MDVLIFFTVHMSIIIVRVILWNTKMFQNMLWNLYSKLAAQTHG